MKGVRILADKALEGRRNMIAGANQDDTHLRNVTPGRDFTAEYADLRVVTAGDLCPKCGKPMRISVSVELGHIFKLGTPVLPGRCTRPCSMKMARRFRW